MVGMLIVALILRVGDDHLGMLCTKDCDQAIHRLIVGATAKQSGWKLASLSGMPESR